MTTRATATLAPSQLPAIVTAVPGPRSRELAKQLARVEGRGVTCLSPPPIFWARAQGANVWDADGNRYLDLTAAFGVVNIGHAHASVLEAIREQSATLLHGLAEVQPSEVKLALLQRLAKLFPGGGDARAVLGSSGSDAVEIAIKTAMLASGRSGLLAFEGGYHGVSLGALDATWRSSFREPFAARLPGATVFARFGDLDHVAEIADLLEAVHAVVAPGRLPVGHQPAVAIAHRLVQRVQVLIGNLLVQGLARENQR